jgi:2-C-methyl-D-erythritol 4-phosphate cytidylyltransferase
MMTGAIIVAAGRGTRMGGVDKCALPLAGDPILLHSVRAFAAFVGRLVVVVASDRRAAWEEIILSGGWPAVDAIVSGGETRTESVRAGLDALGLDSADSITVIHDGARPLITEDMIHRCVAAAYESGAAICAVPVTDTIKRVRDGVIVETPERASLWSAQTPQAFRSQLLQAAFVWARETKQEPFTDEAGLIEAYGHPVHIVRGDVANLKVTNREDLIVAEALLAARSKRHG